MTNELLHGDLCPACRRPLTLRPTTVVRSNVPYPTRTGYLPHCTSCANDPASTQKWNDLMNTRYSS